MPKKRGPGRDELLVAAAHEFADLGYAGASTARIARRARVTQPLVHHHFGSKEGLWLALVDELFGELRGMLEAEAKRLEGRPPLERVQTLLETFVRFCGHHPHLPRLMRTEGRLGNRPFVRLYDRWLSGLIDFFRVEMFAAFQAGALRPVEPSHLYFLVVGAAVEPFVQPQTAQRAFGLDVTTPESIDAYAKSLVDVFVRGLLPED